MTQKKYQEEKSKPVHKMSEKKDVVINNHVGQILSFCQKNGINVSQYITLQMIISSEPKSISELARFRYLSPRAISKHLDKLKEKGFVEVEQVTDDFKYLGSKIKTNLAFHTAYKWHENPEWQRQELGPMFTEIPSGELVGQVFTPILHIGLLSEQLSNVTTTNNNKELPEGHCTKNEHRIPEAREKNRPTPKRMVIKRRGVSEIRNLLNLVIPYSAKEKKNRPGITPFDVSRLAAKLYDNCDPDSVHAYLEYFFLSGKKIDKKYWRLDWLYEFIAEKSNGFHREQEVDRSDFAVFYENVPDIETGEKIGLSIGELRELMQNIG